jgi:lipopolysaccharide biosynthesis glycosyltransferase
VHQDDAPRVHIAFAADNVVSKGLAAAVRSVDESLARAGRTGSVYVVDCGLNARSRRRVTHSADPARTTVTWLTVRGEAHDLVRSLAAGSTRPYPPSAYARLLLPALLPGDVHKVVYLDADTIVRGDIAGLWDDDMGDQPLFAVRDLPLENGNAARIARTVDQARYSYDPAGVYFQSGVLVMDISAFRRERLDESAFAFLREYPTMQFPDQDALNALLATRTRVMDPRWNQMVAIYRYPDAAASPFDEAEFRDLRDDPFVVHFSGRPKPWEPGCEHPWLAEWFALLDRTPWAGWRPTRLNGMLERLPRIPRVAQRRIRNVLRSLTTQDPPPASGASTGAAA